MGLLSRLGSACWRLFESKGGAVAVEFALIVPFAIFVYVGGSYSAAISTLNKKMQSASYALVNTAPFPRTVCSYRLFIEDMYSSGAQMTLAAQLLAPFPVTDDNTTVRFIESAPDADGKFTSRVRIQYTPDSGALKSLLTMWSALGGPSEGGTIVAESADVTITQDIPVCPTTPLRLQFDPVASVTYFEVLNSSAYNNTVTATGGVKFKGKYRPYSVTNLPGGLNFDTETGKFGVAVNVPCNQTSNPKCTPVTLPVTRFSVQDYRDKLYDSAPATAEVDGQFVVYYPVLGTLTVSSGEIVQGQVMAAAFQPRPDVNGGWPVAGAPSGYVYSGTGLPTGLSIDAQTGNISGTTTVFPATYSVTLRATDARGAYREWTYSLRVKAQPLNVWASPPSVVATLNQYFEVPIYATGGAGSLALSCSNQPAGVSCVATGATGNASGVAQQVGWLRGTPTALATNQNVTVRLTDQASNTATAIVVLTVSVPPLNHWFEGWIYGSYAGDWYVGYIGFSGGSGNMSVTGCWAPPGMNCGSDGWRHWFAGNPSPGSGTATIQFRDNLTGVIYTQQAWFSFGSRPIDVWYESHWGDLYSGGWLAVQFRASGGYGGYGYDCYSSTPTESNYLQCYAGFGAWDAGTRTSCISVWDGYGQSRQAYGATIWMRRARQSV
ncbi:hypothetical protein GCM10019059_38070 [Camelimonas fluminis]|uniref:Ig domain-containing protein n=1 Tax=Camelimonas fluminis TaxID=1576911 RepID=A0ABV7UBM0_9HYPH|nr:Ig domain-containing protein [Camelimonas fluminis]GHE74961.1 hypothetical protein GCM10019059_38070 [Camelimonas fluminis]